MGDELGLHFLATVWEEVLVTGPIRELIHSLARTALYKVAGEGFENLVCLHAHVGLPMLQDLQ